MNKITPFLWFNDNAEEAVDFYCSLFANARRLGELRSDVTPGDRSKPLTVEFELEGQQVTALNGGSHVQLNEAFSFVVRCDSQEEIDRYWSALTANGGKESRCGWLKDRFGLSWQIIPANLIALVRDPRGMKAMMTMSKLDIAALEAAVAENA